jgi:hypothetical protein
VSACSQRRSRQGFALCLVALTPSNDTCCAHSTTFREYQRKQVQPLRKVRRWSAQGGAAKRILASDTNAVPVSVP